MTTATIDGPNALIEALRAAGLGRGRTRRIINAPHFAAVRVTAPDGRWLQATEAVVGAGARAELVREFTVDPGPDAEAMRAIARAAGWRIP